MTNSDRDTLLALLRTTVTKMEPGVARFLREEIERADIVNAEISPTAVVLIGSTVKFIDHAALNIRQVTLVLPDEANRVDLISVSGGLGSALIGLGPGQTIRWQEGQIERQVTVIATVLSEPNQTLVSMNKLKSHKLRVGDHVAWYSEAGRVTGTIIRGAPEERGVQRLHSPCNVEELQYEITSDKSEHIALHKDSALKLAPLR
jgi:hypothetical protein